MSEHLIEVAVTGRVATVLLNRPHQLNALNAELRAALVEALTPLDRSTEIGAIVLSGSGRAFAAGADISEMAPMSYDDMVKSDYFGELDAITKMRTPKIAAVNGFALGGGCELAMMCDILIAGQSTQFGLPELTLGVIPGIGGTQRLAHLIGRAAAMDLILTGRRINAEEALAFGLVSRIVEDDLLMSTAAEIAQRVASFSKPAVMLARDAINRAEGAALSEGLLFERRVFQSLFATHDQKEGMQAFLEKRRPEFTGT